MPAAEQILTVAQMRVAEQALIAGGETVGTLMERAGAGAAEWIWRLAACLSSPRVVSRMDVGLRR